MLVAWDNSTRLDYTPFSKIATKISGLVVEILAEEKCVNINPQDVNPPIITPNYNELTAGHQYTNVKNSPPGPGFEVTKMGSSDGCLQAFTPLEFGINTNELCCIDFYKSSISW